MGKFFTKFFDIHFRENKFESMKVLKNKPFFLVIKEKLVHLHPYENFAKYELHPRIMR